VESSGCMKSVVWQTYGGESDDQVLVSRKDLERLQHALRTTNSLLPEILNRELLTAFTNVHTLNQGDFTVNCYLSDRFSSSLWLIPPPRKFCFLRRLFVCFNRILRRLTNRFSQNLAWAKEEPLDLGGNRVFILYRRVVRILCLLLYSAICRCVLVALA